MAKFRANLAGRALEKWAAPSAAEVVPGCDMLVTATALRRAQQLVPVEALHSGLHIHAMGGDCAGKTELPPALLERSTVVVEYLPQSMTEGEVQQCGAGAVHAELWEVVSGRRAGRESADEITLFDCVGFALEDFSALSLVCDLASEYELGRSVELLPSLADPKDLYGLLR